MKLLRGRKRLAARKRAQQKLILAINRSSMDPVPHVELATESSIPRTIVLDTRTNELLPASELSQRAVDYAKKADADATTRAYKSQWTKFKAWCRFRGLEALPAAPGTLALYLTERAAQGARLPTLEQALTSISRKHSDAELPDPRSGRECRKVWKGIRRSVGRAQKKAAPVSPDVLRKMIRACPGPELACQRDAALILVGFAGALRRDELVKLDVKHLAFSDDGLVVTLERSKTDQEGKGATVPLPYGSDKTTCPVRALRAWLASSGIVEGAVFRGVKKGGRLSKKQLHGRDVARVIQRAARHAGIELDNLSGHSLRSGLGTTAAKSGKRLEVIQKHMRHKSMDQTVEYVRNAEMFDEDENAASGIGL
jgi:integrase